MGEVGQAKPSLLGPSRRTRWLRCGDLPIRWSKSCFPNPNPNVQLPSPFGPVPEPPVREPASRFVRSLSGRMGVHRGRLQPGRVPQVQFGHRRVERIWTWARTACDFPEEYPSDSRLLPIAILLTCLRQGQSHVPGTPPDCGSPSGRSHAPLASFFTPTFGHIRVSVHSPHCGEREWQTCRP